MGNTQLQLTPEQVAAAQTAQWKQLLRQALADLRVSAPAIVQSFNAAKQVVSVKIAIREFVRTTTGPQWTEIAPINNVPIVLPRAGGFAITLPIVAGDEGMLVFCDACIDLWWMRGGIQNQFERRRHDISDCGFYPGPWSQPRVLPGYSTNSAQLRKDDGTAYIELTSGGAINLVAPGGVNITGAVASNSTITATGEVKGAGHSLSTHVHADPQGGNTGAPIG